MAGLPLAGHSRLAGVQRMQLDTTIPFRKRCWQTVVVRKIRNQAQCLNILGRAKADMLESLADDVGSGDPDNLESVAARVYFDALFGSSFSRSSECVTNSALNYGYAIMRGAVARGLAGHGFLPAHGIHHHSELNQFNLADDFMEPFRPLVDLCVAEMRPSGTLSKQHREKLVSLLHAQVLIDGNRHSVNRAAELIAGSFVAACRNKDPGLLTAPELLPITMHSYE
jgi:CRISPR-associated protein Cas1